RFFNIGNTYRVSGPRKTTLTVTGVLPQSPVMPWRRRARLFRVICNPEPAICERVSLCRSYSGAIQNPPEMVFARINTDAKAGLAAGFTVIADAVFADPAERQALEVAAKPAGAAFTGIWLDADIESRVERVGAREADASDATAEFLREHPAREHGENTWIRQDASGAPETVARLVLNRAGGPDKS
ncbi:MAG: AAA family ATPase, partial [Alphaproteobacteria bacterium]